MDILTHLTKIQLKFEAELRGIRPNEIKFFERNKHYVIKTNLIM